MKCGFGIMRINTIVMLSFLAILRGNTSIAEVLPDWPEFRGPTGQGIAVDADPPLTWSQTENVAWKQTIPGKGWSSPIIYQGSVYLTTALEDKSHHPTSLRALRIDATTGKILWDKEVLPWSGKSPKQTKNSHASGTPIAADGRIYCHFSHMGTACVDVDGTIIWAKQDLPYSPLHGTGSSPILYQDKLIYNCDAQKDPFVVARNKHTGEVVWKTPRHTKARNKFSFSTPLLIEENGKPVVVSVGSGVVCAYNPDNGAEIWRVDIGEAFSIPMRPVFGHGMIYISSGFDSPGTVFAIRVGGKGDVTKSHIVWTREKDNPETPSMLLSGPDLYYMTDKATAYCVDAVTGDERWKVVLKEGVKVSASPVLANGRIYQTLENGCTVVFKPGIQFEKLAENNLGEYTLASPAVSGRALFIRTESHLYRIEELQ